eukprot:6325691-Amphidinium_carterae.2
MDCRTLSLTCKLWVAYHHELLGQAVAGLVLLRSIVQVFAQHDCCDVGVILETPRHDMNIVQQHLTVNTYIMQKSMGEALARAACATISE